MNAVNSRFGISARAAIGDKGFVRSDAHSGIGYFIL
jgi:hypothetical protein